MHIIKLAPDCFFSLWNGFLLKKFLLPWRRGLELLRPVPSVWAGGILLWSSDSVDASVLLAGRPKSFALALRRCCYCWWCFAVVTTWALIDAIDVVPETPKLKLPAKRCVHHRTILRKTFFLKFLNGRKNVLLTTGGRGKKKEGERESGCNLLLARWLSTNWRQEDPLRAAFLSFRFPAHRSWHRERERLFACLLAIRFSTPKTDHS